MNYGRTLLRWRIMRHPFTGTLYRRPQHGGAWLALGGDNMLVSDKMPPYIAVFSYGKPLSHTEEIQALKKGRNNAV